MQAHGINSYPLLQLLGEERQAAVQDIFAQALALGRPLIRTNAFLDGGESPARIRNDDGSIHPQGLVQLDRLLALAAEAGVRLLLVLTNNWPDFGGAEAVLRTIAPGQALPKDAFWSDPRAQQAQRAYIRTLVTRHNSITGTHYASDPTVFAWELANEARCSQAHACNAAILVRWARVMAEQVRACGASQPVAWGGSGYSGEFGEDLAAIAADGAVDILTAHVYPRLPVAWAAAFTREARIGWATMLGAARLHRCARIARRHGLPLLVEELGYRPPPTARDLDHERAAVLGALLAICDELELGTLPWMIGERDRPDYDGHLLRASDRASWQAISRS